jgi:hypothetical protein
LLLSGDALITVKQESLLAVLAQRPEVRRPPAYYTIDWKAVVASIRRLASLDPAILATGHGPTLMGAEVRAGLAALLARPRELIVPRRGWYVRHPARPSTQPALEPHVMAQRSSQARAMKWTIAGSLAVLGYTTWRLNQRRRVRVS